MHAPSSVEGVYATETREDRSVGGTESAGRRLMRRREGGGRMNFYRLQAIAEGRSKTETFEGENLFLVA